MPKTLDDFLAHIEAEARREGPDAVALLRALDEHYALEAKHLQLLKEAAKVSQRELARASGIDQGDLSKILSGKVDPRWSTVRRIVAALKKLMPRAHRRLAAAIPARPRARKRR